MTALSLVVVTSGFPRLSETFALAELVALAEAGVLAAVYATKPGDGLATQPGAAELADLVRVLPPGDAAAQAAALVADLAVRADLLGRPIDAVHGYFAHQPAAVAAAAAARLGVPYSFSMHALDARKVPPTELVARARGARGVVACNDDVAGHLRGSGAALRVLPHGVDLARFSPALPRVGGPLRILAVGRMVEKKGLPVLIDAVARLRRDWLLRIVGDGPERARLQAEIAASGTGDRITLVGRRTHEELPAEYEWADVVAVPSIVDSRGDRDGLPNVVLETMASGRAVVASDVAAIGATVRTAGAGLLVPPHDASALAEALELFARRPRLRRAAGRAGRRYATEHYDVTACTARLLRHLEVLHGRVSATNSA